MSLNVVSLFRSTPRSRDWSNQELAEFYRVEASLVRAAIPVEVDRGRSDEGDPWFVFCHAVTGDVIVHFALLDGTYVVASPALGSCARGRDFRALIEAQIESHPLVMPKSSGNTKLFIHPAALLIVLVTTCFFKLSQTSAVASELNASHSSSSGAGTHKVAGDDPAQHAVLLDERSAAVVLAAVAVAVTWAQADNADLWLLSSASTEMDIPSQQVFGPAAAAFSDSFDTFYGIQFQSHSLVDTAGTVGLDIGASSLADTLSRAAAWGVASYHQISQQLTNLDVPTPTANQISPNYLIPATHEYIIDASYGNLKSNPIPGTNATSFLAAPTLAVQEVNELAGASIQTHVVDDIKGSQQQLVIHTADTLSTPITEIPSTTNGSVTASVSHTTSLATVIVNTVEAAILQFMASTPDFKIIDYQKEVIIYDPHLTFANLTTAVQETFAFHDGSSVVLIGLPLPETAPHLPI